MTSELKSMFGENIPDQTTLLPKKHKKELERKKKELMKKQTGMKRELFKLIGQFSDIVENTGNKNSKSNSNWVWSPFSNPARSDNLKLVHWQRAEDVNKDYDFAKFNKSIEIVEFTKEEYDKLIKQNDTNWNYEQTCYLWDLIKRYELRFVVVKDRFDEEKYGERSIESLKDRYYSVAKIILENRKMFDHPIIKSGYNYDQEMKRRNYLEKNMNKTLSEPRDEQEMEENLKKMEDNDNTNLKLKLPNFDSPNKTNILEDNNKIQIPLGVEETENINSENKNINEINGINMEQFQCNNDQTFEDFIKNNITKNDSFVYLRSQKLKHNLPVSEKIQERVDSYMKEFNLPKLMPTAQVEISYDNLRNNIILYTTLKKYLEKKDKEYIFLKNKLEMSQNIKNYKINGKPRIKSSLKYEKNNLRNAELLQEANINANIILEPTDSDNNNNGNNIIIPNEDGDQSEINEKKKKKILTLRGRKRKNINEITNTDEKDEKFHFTKKKRGNK